MTVAHYIATQGPSQYRVEPAVSSLLAAVRIDKTVMRLAQKRPRRQFCKPLNTHPRKDR